MYTENCTVNEVEPPGHSLIPLQLIVMTPKSLLRLPEARSPLEDMQEGTSFQRVIGDGVCVGGAGVKRVVLCSGKIYYELLSTRKEKEKEDTVAIVRVEQVSMASQDTGLELY